MHKCRSLEKLLATAIAFLAFILNFSQTGIAVAESTTAHMYIRGAFHYHSHLIRQTPKLAKTLIFFKKSCSVKTSCNQSNSYLSQSSRLFASSPSSPASHRDIKMQHFDSLSSTQDEAKKLLLDRSFHEPNSHIAITTASQTKGRGTNNRTWIGRTGNTFLTIAVPSSDLKIPLTLLPLQIGNLLAQQVQKVLKSSNAVVTLKWPNDVLVDQNKIAGVLIESTDDYAGNHYFLIGIGVNYKFAPKVDTSGAERGRETTCISNYLKFDDDREDDGIEDARELGINIAKDVKEWIEMQKEWDGAAESIVTNWESWAEFGNKLVLRDEPGNESVVPLSIEKDGRLRVKGKDGKERILCVEYLL